MLYVWWTKSYFCVLFYRSTEGSDTVLVDFFSRLSEQLHNCAIDKPSAIQYHAFEALSASCRLHGLHPRSTTASSTSLLLRNTQKTFESNPFCDAAQITAIIVFLENLSASITSRAELF